MAYDPTIPSLGNYIGDDIAKIRENFAELAGSRIVDHNLDVANPPNGWYVRWENGLQVCWHILVRAGRTATTTGPLYRDDAATMWAFPAAFITPPTVYGTVLRVSDDSYRLFVAPNSVTTTSVTYRDVATMSGDAVARQDQLLALGRWK